MIVGRTVRRRKVERTARTVTLLGRRLPMPHGDGETVYERDPTKLLVRDVAASEPEPAKEPFVGCARRCTGINWYCIENPRCFATK